MALAPLCVTGARIDRAEPGVNVTDARHAAAVSAKKRVRSIPHDAYELGRM